jgi:hypothetical protein
VLTKKDIVGRLPEYRELATVDLGGLPKEALLATIKDLAETLVFILTAPSSEMLSELLDVQDSLSEWELRFVESVGD